MSKSLTPSKRRADECKAAQGNRYVHVHRPLCGTAEETSHQSRSFRRGARRKERGADSDALQMGIRGSLPGERSNSTRCRCLKYQGFTAHRRKEVKFLEKLSKCRNFLLTILQTSNIIPLSHLRGAFSRPRRSPKPVAFVPQV